MLDPRLQPMAAEDFYGTIGDPISFVNIPKAMRKKKVYIVPPGIGDIAWIYSKLYATEEDDFILAVTGMGGNYRDYGISMRAFPFIKLLEKICFSTLALCGTDHLCRISDKVSMRDGRLPESPAFLCFNSHLDRGVLLDDILPSLKTVRHFPMRKPRWAENEAGFYIRPGQKAIAVYTSSSDYYAGENFSTEDWIEIMNRLMDSFPDHRFLLIGSPWDLNLMLPLKNSMRCSGFGDRIEMVHDRDIAVTLAILRRCDFLLGCVSGLTIVAEYQRVPTVHLYPKQLYQVHNLIGHWESNEMVREGKSLSLRIGSGAQKAIADILTKFRPAMQIDMVTA